MKHLGDITKIDWFSVEPVDVVTGGSPCQDLSVGGKRAGLAGERSGLYMEQIRCVKELRQADVLRGRTGQFIRPRFMVWENVPGAFSSGNPKGADFAAVIEELIKAAEPDAEVRVLPPSDGWTKSGCYYDCDGRWSIAWRVHDAQFWGVPQRRKRIALVADFGGGSAPEILFEREGVRGYFAEGRTPWQGIAAYAQDCTGADDRAGIGGVIPINTMIATRHKALGRGTGFGVGDSGDPQFTISAGHEHAVAYTLEPGIAAREGGHVYEGVSGTLRAEAGDNRMAVAYSFDSLASNSMKSSNPHSGCRQVEVAKTLDTTDPNPSKNQGGIAIVEPIVFAQNQRDEVRNLNDKAGALQAEPGMKQQTFVAVPYTLKIRSGCEGGGNDQYLFQPVTLEPGIDRADTAGCNGKGWKEDTSYTLNTIDRPAVAYCVGNGQLNQITMAEQANTLDCMHDQQAVCYREEPPIAIDRAFFNQGQNAKYDPQCYTDGTVPTLVARGPSAVAHKMEVRYIVRRLTPLECERLQGYPDGWTDIGEWVDSKGKKHKEADSPRYKALGNSIALPFWKVLAKRISAQYDRDVTMGSLFDGIGGFPLVFEQINGKGTARWASEIEEFPMAVTKLRFGED